MKKQKQKQKQKQQKTTRTGTPSHGPDGTDGKLALGSAPDSKTLDKSSISQLDDILSPKGQKVKTWHRWLALRLWLGPWLEPRDT